MNVDTMAAGIDTAHRDAERAESLMFDGIWFGEHGNDPLDALLIAAAFTTSVRLGTAITGALTRSPMECAYRLATAQLLAGRQVSFGVGSQARPVVRHQYGADWSHPLSRLAEFHEALCEIWEAWSDDRQPKFRGNFYHHTYCPPACVPSTLLGRPPILLGAVGARAQKLAAETFDGLITHPCTPPEYLRDVIGPRFRSLAACRSGTPPELVSLSMLIYVEADEAHARIVEDVRLRLWHWAASGIHHDAFAYLGMEEVERAAIRGMRREHPADIEGIIDEDVINSFCTIGPASVIRSSIARDYVGLADRTVVIIDDSVTDEAALRLVEEARAI